MSNPINTSNQSSAIVATINESGGLRVPHVYSEENRLVPPHAIQILPVPAEGTVGASKSVTFQIPKVGFLQGVWLNFTMPSDGDAEQGAEIATDAQTETQAGAVITQSASDDDGFNALGAYQCIREIRCETSGRTIESLDAASILARISDLPYGKRRAVEHAARMAGDPDDYNNPYNVCLWVPFWFNSDAPGAGDPRYSYNTLFNEPMRIVLSFSDCKCLYKTGSDFAVHAPTDAEVLCRYNILDDKSLDMVVQENQGSGMLSQLITVMKPESDYSHTSESSGTTSTAQIDLKENDAVTAIYFTVERDSTAATSSYAGALKTKAPLEVKNVQLKFNNTSVFDVPGTWLQHFGRVGQEGDGTDAGGPSSMRYVYKLDFALLPGMGLTSNTVAMRELSSPQLIVTYRHNGTSTEHKIKVRYATKSFLTVASNSGRVSLSISS